MRVQAATCSLENSHTISANPPTSQLALLAHSLGCFVWSTNTVSEGTSSWLDSRTGCVARIAATSRVLDCSCVEAQDQGVLMEELAKSWGFPGMSCSCCAQRSNW